MYDNSWSKYISLECKDYVKYLGILIDNKLSWKPHIDLISTKISRTIGLIARLRHYIPANTLITLYKSLIQPYLFYGLCSWGQANKTNLSKLLLLQKKALRLIYFANQRESAIPLFLITNILPVTFSYYETVASLMYDVVNQIAPSNICNLFSFVSNVHSYNTRSSTSNDLFTEYSRTNAQCNSLSRVGVRLWNKIPEQLRKLPKKTFKKRLRSYLFDNLEKLGYDAEISKLDFSDMPWIITAITHEIVCISFFYCLNLLYQFITIFISQCIYFNWFLPALHIFSNTSPPRLAMLFAGACVFVSVKINYQ